MDGSEHKPARVELLDVLRGFALLGLFFIHCVELYDLYWANPTGGFAATLVFGLFGGKASALFALCFGVSFFLIMESAKRQGRGYRARFVWRLLLLFAMGLVHGLLYRGDILQVLALVGGLLLIADRVRSNGALLVLSMACLAQLPLLIRARAALHGAGWAVQKPFFMSDWSLPSMMHANLAALFKLNLLHGQWVKWSIYVETGRLAQMIGLFIVGLVLGRIHFFRNPGDHRGLRRTMVGGALASMLFLTTFGSSWLDLAAGANEHARLYLRWAAESWTALALLALQVGGLVELYETSARKLLSLLAPLGRMTLSLYVLQSIVMVPVFYGFGLGLYQKATPMLSLGIAAAGIGVQMLFARWWFRHFLYGPLEWLWRAGTRRSRAIPFRRPLTPAMAA